MLIKSMLYPVHSCIRQSAAKASFGQISGLNKIKASRLFVPASGLCASTTIASLIAQPAFAETAYHQASTSGLQSLPIEFRQDRTELMIPIGEQAPFEDIKLLIPSARQVHRQGKEYAIIATYADRQQAYSEALRVEPSIPWELELLTYNAKTEKIDVSPNRQSFNHSSQLSELSPRIASTTKTLATLKTNTLHHNTFEIRKYNATDLGGVLSITSPYHDLLFMSHNSLSATNPTRTGAPWSLTQRSTQAQAANSLENNQATSQADLPVIKSRSIIPPIDSEKPPSPKSTAADAPVSLLPEPQIHHQYTRHDLHYLVVELTNDNDLEMLKRIAPVSHTFNSNSRSYAQVGVYARTRIGERLLSQRIFQLKNHGFIANTLLQVST